MSAAILPGRNLCLPLNLPDISRGPHAWRGAGVFTITVRTCFAVARFLEAAHKVERMVERSRVVSPCVYVGAGGLRRVAPVWTL